MDVINIVIFTLLGLFTLAMVAEAVMMRLQARTDRRRICAHCGRVTYHWITATIGDYEGEPICEDCYYTPLEDDLCEVICDDPCEECAEYHPINCFGCDHR